MILQHLYAFDFLCGKILVGDAVLAPHEVKSFDVELVDGHALIADGTAFRDFQSRHLFDDIGDASVLPLFEGVDGVGEGVTHGSYLGSFDLYFLQLEFSRFHGDGHAIFHVRKRDVECFITHVPYHYLLRLDRVWDDQVKLTIAICYGKTDGMVVVAKYYDIGTF